MQGLGIVVWAFAKLGCDAACPAVMRLLDEFAAEALRRLEHPGGDPTMQLGAQSLSNLVRASARARERCCWRAADVQRLVASNWLVCCLFCACIFQRV